MTDAQREHNSWAITHAVFKEQAAVATGHYYQRASKPGSGRELLTLPTVAVPTLVLTSTNQTAYPLAENDFLGSVAQFMDILDSTALGDVLERQQSDIQADGQGYSLYGEPMRLSSLGIASVYLPRTALKQYAQCRGTIAWIEAMLGSSDRSDVAQAALTTLRQHSIFEGENVHDLSNRLLNDRLGNNSRTTLERFSALSARDLAALKGRQVWTQAEFVVSQVRQSLGDWNVVLTERGSYLVTQAVMPSVDRELQLALCHPQRGVVWAEQFRQELLRQTNEMLEGAIADQARLEAALHSAEQQVQLCQRQQGFGSAKRMAYHRSLQSRETVRLRQWGRKAAIATLQQLQQAVQAYQPQLQRIIATLNHLRTQAQSKLEALELHRFKQEVPNGICLVNSSFDWNYYYNRLIAGGEVELLAAIYHQLATVENPLLLLAEAQPLDNALKAWIHQVIEPHLASLHIVDELSDRPELLLELHRKAAEFIQLKDGTASPRRRWLMLLNRRQTGDRLVEQLKITCRISCESIEVDDLDQVYLLSYRWNFSFSDFKHFAHMAQDAYEQVSRERPYESLHAIAGDRGLPRPGSLFSPLEAKQLVVQAALLEIFHQNGDFIKSDFDGSICLSVLREMISLENAMQFFCDRRDVKQASPYCIAVKIVSHYNCLFQRQGVEFLRQQIEALPAYLNDFLTDDVRQKLLADLRHCEKNVVPNATEWKLKIENN